jgi:tetratricopeptide (TPR) repeat protein
VLRQRAKVLNAQGQGEAAEQNLGLALKIDRAMGKAGFAADDLYGLGLAASARGQEAQAEGLLGQALDASRQAGYKRLEADTLVELMAARLSQGKTASAEELAAPLDALVKEMKTPPLQVRAGEVEGWLAEVKGDDEGAARRYAGAIDALEKIRGGLTVEALHVGLMKAHAGLYGRMVAMLAQMAQEGKAAPVGVGNGEEAELTALHYAEAGRARALLAQMAGVFSADLQGMSETDATGIKAAEEGVAKSRQALWTELARAQPDRDKAEGLARDVRKKQGDADALRDRMLAKYPASAQRMGREQVVGGADAMQVCVDRTCAALEYWVGEDESWGWVVDPWSGRRWRMPSTGCRRR